MTFTSILEKYRSISFSERNKGERFERLMQAFLQTYPVYKGKFAHVWLWNEFPHKDDLGGRDTGIDLVCKTNDGEYWAVQCKCYDEKSVIDKPAVDSFLATSSKTFVNDLGETTAFSVRLWISTTSNWGSGAENAIKYQIPSVQRINLADLQNAAVDWEELDKGIYGEKARAPKKTPREHQQRAIDAFHEHFKTEKRGKLIMACGTGKTFTSLKIAEKETGGKGIVLFLAPSIALVGQTLREWMAESAVQISPVCICSDPEVSRTKKKRDDDLDGETIVDLALPASTSPDVIVSQIKKNRKSAPDSLVVIFSTYQSIDTVASVQQKLGGAPIDIVICDEAHRTTGVTLKDDDESAFVRIHDDKFIRAKKRVYMTATPRLYTEDSKKKAKDADAILCSMDDKAIYGEEVFHIGFGEAVDKGLLADYKVLILTLNESEIPAALQKAVADKDQEINVDDVSKLIGCIKALSKNMRTDEGLLKTSDPSLMHKAVAFCSSIRESRHICEIFNNFKDSYSQDLPDSEKEELVNVVADHVDGSMGAGIREGKLSWLNSTPQDGRDCRILCNVRCLSEGVDVPSLDAVLFLSARNSQVDVVQSVGRVMRTAPGKMFGYIIIPILIPSSVRPEEALNDNKRFAVVWSVLNALRAHDDRFSALVNRIALHERPLPPKIIIDDGGSGGTWDGDGTSSPLPGTIADPQMVFPGLATFFYARMVQKVGDRRYWEQWAADVAEIVQRYMERITRLIASPGPHKDAFDEFLGGLQKNINPSVTQDEVVVMLAQHMITKPVFEALFENYSFVQNNPVSKSMQAMVDLLEEQALEKDAIVLSRFYESVRMRVSGITSTEGRQRTITELYDKFFRIAFPKTVDKLGIVYTPVEVVDFINRSVADILNATFGCTLSDKNVHVLDPFTGTGTFIARMIASGLIERDALPYKYEHELHANEIVLLAYYIASINIENVFHDTQGKEAEYKPFKGICLTDTFQLGETDGKSYLVTPKMQQNSERVKAQKELPIQIIIGNPPYSVGQKSANDNAQNQSYPVLESRIANTYASLSTAKLKTSLYDSYIKAFRWASDRLPKEQPGIIAFVTNAGWLDGNAMNGFRKCLEEEFSAVYVFNLRGNQRTSGELSRREGGKIFGSGSRTPIAITILVRNPKHEGKALINYCDIGDYLSREEKLEILVKKRSALSSLMQWQQLHPDAHGDWLNKRNDVFETFIPLGDKDNKKNTHTFFAQFYTNGLKTNRDAWCWNYSKELLSENIANAIEFYNSEVARLSDSIPSANDIDRDEKKFSWSSKQLQDLVNNKKYYFQERSFYTGMYRPFQKSWAYFSSQLNERVGKLPSLFPTQTSDNILICVSGIGVTKEFSCIISSKLPDFELIGKSQCFPLYYYKEKSAYEPTLIDSLNTSDSRFERKYAVTDFIHEQCRAQYGPMTTKEDIFYYVYGLLHSPDYRTAFAADLKKMLPRLPLIEKPADFRAFSKAGRALAALHLNYEEQPACADVTVEGTEHGNFHVEKMRFPDKNDKSVIEYNSAITLRNIPLEAYDYVVNGRSAIEWIMERYQVRQDKASGIVNDPNAWAKEHEKPRYILDLLLSVITVSLETMKIVKGLPKLTFTAS